MKGPESQTALVVAQSTALVRKAAAKLAKRGLGELWLLESAEEWFEKAKTARVRISLLNSLNASSGQWPWTLSIQKDWTSSAWPITMALVRSEIKSLRSSISAEQQREGHAVAQYHLGLVYD